MGRVGFGSVQRPGTRLRRVPVGHISIDFAARSVCDLYVTYRSEKWSGRLDSNQRAPAPKCHVLRLCAPLCDNQALNLLFVYRSDALTPCLDVLTVLS